MKFDAKSRQLSTSLRRESRSSGGGDGQDYWVVPIPSRERSANALRHASGQLQPRRRYRVYPANETLMLLSPASLPPIYPMRFQTAALPRCLKDTQSRNRGRLQPFFRHQGAVYWFGHIGFCTPEPTKWHPKVECGDTFFNSVLFSCSWFVFAPKSRRLLTSGTTPRRRATTLNTAL